MKQTSRKNLVQEPRTSKPALVIMARWSAAGRCKKRLAAEIGLQKAALIQKKLTEHTLHVAKSVALKGHVELQLAFSGLAPRAAKRWGLHLGVSSLYPQGKGDLGLRMRRQILRVQRDCKIKSTSGRSTILIGTDLPELCEYDLLLALDALKRKEIVLGPAFDGGYWLIGLTGRLVTPVAIWPFCGIPWGTNQVLQKTLQSADCRYTEYELLYKKNDLDFLEDISPWQI